jgi:PhzF family phenazine biosynthesis protein
MALRVYQVDAFTDRPFAGNPAAVVLLDAPAQDTAWAQVVAAEMNLPATAFVGPADGAWALRWFSASAELSLCGHGTLAAAHVLARELGTGDEVLSFATASGVLEARPGRDGWIELDLPAHPPAPAPDDAGAVAAALYPAGGAPAFETWRGGDDLLVVVPDAADVERLAPDHAALAAIPARVTIVSGRGPSAGYDFVSRVFAPSVGVAEDPVTGSAHCLLGPYWSARLGRPVLSARQASPRGGVLRIEVRGGRVGVAGQAVTVARGELTDAVVAG